LEIELQNNQETQPNAEVAEPAANRIAFYGGSFDPMHSGHLEIGKAVIDQFELSEFVYVPAFHAPHKLDRKPTSAFHRFAMLSLSTINDNNLSVSAMELEMPERPFTVETLGRLINELPAAEIYFVMGADSWADICTWREWEQVLTMSNHIVVTRPGHPIKFDHVTDSIRKRIIDVRGSTSSILPRLSEETRIYLTDAVESNASASEIRKKIQRKEAGWSRDVPIEVAKYIEKYELYR